jgi:hypothetical protein
MVLQAQLLDKARIQGMEELIDGCVNKSSMRPEDVNPRNFNWHHILYDDDDFSIAYGEWVESGGLCVAMRWNESPNGTVGFPHAFGQHPMWFVLTDEFKRGFLIYLLKKCEKGKRSIIKQILWDETNHKNFIKRVIKIFRGY